MSGHLPGLCLANEAGPNAPLTDAVVEAWPGRQGARVRSISQLTKVFDTHRVTKLSKGLTSFALLFRSFLFKLFSLHSSVRWSRRTVPPKLSKPLEISFQGPSWKLFDPPKAGISMDQLTTYNL